MSNLNSTDRQMIEFLRTIGTKPVTSETPTFIQIADRLEELCPVNVSGKERVYEDLTLDLDAETYSTIEEMASLADVSIAQLIKIVLVQQLYNKGLVTKKQTPALDDQEDNENDVSVGGTD